MYLEENNAVLESRDKLACLLDSGCVLLHQHILLDTRQPLRPAAILSRIPVKSRRGINDDAGLWHDRLLDHYISR